VFHCDHTNEDEVVTLYLSLDPEQQNPVLQLPCNTVHVAARYPERQFWCVATDAIRT
jgi:hypothetical protein